MFQGWGLLMRKLLIVALLMTGLFGLHLSAQAGEEGAVELKKGEPRAVAVAPPRAGPSPAAIAELILDGGNEQQIFAAQWLARADHDSVLEVQRAIRARVKPGSNEPDTLRTPEGASDVITIETRFVQGPANWRNDIAVRFEGPTPEGLPAGTDLLDDTQVELILRAIKGGKLDLITAPRISVYDGQRANVSVLNQQSYVSDFSVVKTERGQIANPWVQVIKEGVMVDMRPTLSADKRYVTLDFHATFAELQRPIPQRTIKVGRNEMRIQRPHVDLGLALTHVTVPIGGAVLIWPEGGPSRTADGKHTRAVFVRISEKLLRVPGPGGSEIDLTTDDGGEKPAAPGEPKKDR